MTRLSLLLLLTIFTTSIYSQTFKKETLVEIDILLSDTTEGKWQRATVTDYDSVAKMYMVTLADGKKTTIPGGNPEKWIRPVVAGNGMNQYGQGVKFAYQARNKAINGFRCNASEAGIKKNIRAQLAEYY